MSSDQPIDPVNVRPKEAARLLGLSRRMIDKMIASGELESFKRGTRSNSPRLIKMASIRAYRGVAP